MPASRPARPPFQRLRRGLLAGLAIALAGLAGLYLLGRPKPAGEEKVDRDETAASESLDERQAIVMSEGFEYEQRIGERSAFRLEGQRFVTGRDGVVNLEGVALELTRESGDSYRIESERATYHPEEQEARLAGEVRLAGGRGFALHADRLDLIDGGRTVVSRGVVRFELGSGFTGRASSMRFDSENDRFALAGRVRMSGQRAPDDPPLALEADDLVLDRGTRIARAVGRVELTSGSDRLGANEIDVGLGADEKTVESAIARGQVSGRLAAEESDGEEGGRLRFEGTSARVDFAGSPARPSALDLEGGPEGPARVNFRDDQGDTRTLIAPHLVAALESGRPTGAGASGGVRLRESARGAEGRLLREARSESAQATFAADGSLARVVLVGGVVLTQADLEATGDRVEVDFSSGSAVLLGTPAGPARARNQRGELLAPRIEVARAQGKLRASGGVRASFVPGTGGLRLAPAEKGGGETIQVEAREAEWDDRARSWAFRGRVQAVQGESLLFADELEGSEQEGRVTARGTVNTVWREAPAGTTAAGPSTTVTADGLVYLRNAGRIEYHDHVLARQEGRELASDLLVVELDAEQRARKMTASGTLRLDDRPLGRTVTGETAIHDLEAKTIVVEGSPVVLAESTGSTIRGRRLLYDLGSGSARMISGAESP